MKKLIKIPMVIIGYTGAILIGLCSNVSPFMGNPALDTKKIDGNIERLKQFSWFKDLYEDEKYHRSFFINRKVRAYLQSSFRVTRIMKNKQAQRKFMALLEKHAPLSDKS